MTFVEALPFLESGRFIYRTDWGKEKYITRALPYSSGNLKTIYCKNPYSDKVTKTTDFTPTLDDLTAMDWGVYTKRTKVEEIKLTDKEKYILSGISSQFKEPLKSVCYSISSSNQVPVIIVTTASGVTFEVAPWNRFPNCRFSGFEPGKWYDFDKLDLTIESDVSME